jgi:DNA topoisomerase-3
MLGGYLPLLRPAPVIALTATATVLVQDDIVAFNSNMGRATRYIHGFRRPNLAVETVELRGIERHAAVRRILADPGRRPAIVYAPTRKETDALALELAARIIRPPPITPAWTRRSATGCRAVQRQPELAGDRRHHRVWHGHRQAGYPHRDSYRAAGQRRGLLPGNRPGRARWPAGPRYSAVFLRDLRTHEYFHRRSYPDPHLLAQIFAALNTDAQPKVVLRDWLGIDLDEFEAAVEKLLVHGGARRDSEGNLSRGEVGWQRPYQQQSAHKLREPQQMLEFADQATGCRMVRLVRHFGDQEDDQPCGICDVCAPQATTARRTRSLNRIESQWVLQVLASLQWREGQTPRQLCERLTEGLGDRRTVERLLEAMAGTGLVELREDAFTKEGQVITFRRVYLTEVGRKAGVSEVGMVRLTEKAAEVAPRRKRSRVRGR